MSNSAPDHLASWNDGATKAALIEFVERVTRAGGAGHVPPAERVAVFDNDGTLWCEKPMPIQADVILRRLSEMAQADPGLRGRQPWKAAFERDYGWLGTVLDEHYAGNDTNVGTLLAGSWPPSTGSASRTSRPSQAPSYAPRSTRPWAADISTARTRR